MRRCSQCGGNDYPWILRQYVVHSYGHTAVLAHGWDWQQNGNRPKSGTRIAGLTNLSEVTILYDQMGAGAGAGEYPVSPIAQVPVDTQRLRFVSWAGSGQRTN